MPLQLLVTFSNDSDTLIQVMNDVNNQEFGFNFSKKPVDLKFDPNRNILMKQASTIYGIKKPGGVSGFTLDQNAPNPFSNSTSVSYSVPFSEKVKISVYDSSGNMMESPVNKIHAPGLYRFEWTPLNAAPGIYYLRLDAGKFHETKKMIMIK